MYPFIIGLMLGVLSRWLILVSEDVYTTGYVLKKEGWPGQVTYLSSRWLLRAWWMASSMSGNPVSFLPGAAFGYLELNMVLEPQIISCKLALIICCSKWKVVEIYINRHYMATSRCEVTQNPVYATHTAGQEPLEYEVVIPSSDGLSHNKWSAIISGPPGPWQTVRP